MNEVFLLGLIASTVATSLTIFFRLEKVVHPVIAGSLALLFGVLTLFSERVETEGRIKAWRISEFVIIVAGTVLAMYPGDKNLMGGYLAPWGVKYLWFANLALLYLHGPMGRLRSGKQ